MNGSIASMVEETSLDEEVDTRAAANENQDSPAVNETDNSHWSAWQDNAAHTDYEEEIENELASMDANESLKSDRRSNNSEDSDLQNGTQSRPPRPDPGPPVQVDWSDVKSEPRLTKKPLILKGKLKKGDATAKTENKSDKPDRTVESDDFDDWGDGWNDGLMPQSSVPDTTITQTESNPTDSQKSLKPEALTATNSKAALKAATLKSGKAPRAKLGEEFDVLAIEIKSEKSEFDFFAEMEPEIKPQGSSLLETLAAGMGERKPIGGLPSSLATLGATPVPEAAASKLNYELQATEQVINLPQEQNCPKKKDLKNFEEKLNFWLIIVAMVTG